MTHVLSRHIYTMSEETFEDVRSVVDDAFENHINRPDLWQHHVDNLEDSASTLSQVVTAAFDQILRRRTSLGADEFGGLAVRLFINRLAETIPGSAKVGKFAGDRHPVAVPLAPVVALLTRSLDAQRQHPIGVEALHMFLDAISGYCELMPNVPADSYPRLRSLCNQEWIDGTKTFYKSSITEFIDQAAIGDAEEIAETLLAHGADHGRADTQPARELVRLLTRHVAIFQTPDAAEYFSSKMLEHLIAFLPDHQVQQVSGRMQASDNVAKTLRQLVSSAPGIDERTRRAFLAGSLWASPRSGQAFLKKRLLAQEMPEGETAGAYLQSLSARLRPRA